MAEPQYADDNGGILFTANRPIVPDGKLPSGRNGCTTVYADGKLVVFGGTYTESEGKFAYMDETWLLDCATMHWHKMNCTGQIPPARYGHCAHIVGSRMFIFGGKGHAGEIFNDVYFLDLVEWIWVPVATLSTGPVPRLYHASTLVGRKLVIHGGWNGITLFDDMWIFNTDSFGWMQPKTSGFAPSARYGHSLTLSPDGRLFIFGGCSMSAKDPIVPCYNNDIRTLDTDTMIWTRPKVIGNLPTGRFSHSATLLDGNTKLVIYGGWGKGGVQTKEIINNPRAFSVHVLDLTTLSWYIPQWNSKKPLKHYFNHGSSGTFDSDSILIFGGSDGRQSVNDFMVLNFDFPQMEETGEEGQYEGNGQYEYEQGQQQQQQQYDEERY